VCVVNILYLLKLILIGSYVSAYSEYIEFCIIPFHCLHLSLIPYHCGFYKNYKIVTNIIKSLVKSLCM
jgi:hypothetical protein